MDLTRSIFSTSGYEGGSSSNDISKHFLGKTPKIKRLPPVGKNTIRILGNRTLPRGTIAAVWEGRGNDKGLVGLAWADEENAEWIFTEFRDSCGYTTLTSLLHLCEPIEVLVAESLNDKSASILINEAIKSTLPSVVITSVQRRFYNAERGLSSVKMLATLPELTKSAEDKAFACAAMGALIRFVEFKNSIILSAATIPFKLLDVTHACLLDHASWKNIEIVNENLPRKEKRTLLTAIDNTLTSVGYRMLRANLMQPLTDISAIERRQEAIQELLDNPVVLEQLIALLNRVYELDGVVNVCCREFNNQLKPTREQAENEILQLLWLFQTLKIVPTLKEVLAKCQSPLLTECMEHLNDERLSFMMNALTTTLDESVLNTKRSSISLIQQKLFAILPRIDPRIDAAREVYMQKLALIEESSCELERSLPGENTRLAYSVSRGFHFVWNTDPATAKLPMEFINEVRHRTCITFSSLNLLKLNERVNIAEEELLVTSGLRVRDLIVSIRPSIGTLYALIDDLSLLDMLQSMAIYASNTDTCLPKFSEDIVIVKGRHPILDLHIGNQIVANDMYLTRNNRFAIITGPNMAGKSTFLKQLCQLCLLAQMGSFVPAIMCKVPIFKRMFSRIGHNDNLKQHLSAFALEMRDMSTILNIANRDSLIVIDELARSTATEEGIAISYAMAEELIRKHSYTLLATHFLDLAALDVTYSAAVNFHFKSIEEDSNIDATRHRLFKGPYKGPLYGFDIIQLATFPSELIEEAEKLAYQLRAESEQRRELDIDTLKRRALLRTGHRLKAALPQLRMANHKARLEYLSSLSISLKEELEQLSSSEFSEATTEEPSELVDKEAFVNELLDEFETQLMQATNPIDASECEEAPEDPPAHSALQETEVIEKETGNMVENDEIDEDIIIIEENVKKNVCVVLNKTL